MKNLKYFNKYFWKYKWHFAFGIVFVTLANYFGVMQPKIIREGIDLVIYSTALYGLAEGTAAQSDISQYIGRLLLYFGGLVLLLAFIMGIFMYFMRQTIIVMSRLIEYDLRKEIFAHYEALDQSFYRRNNTGDLMARITEDVSKVRMFLGPAILYGINLTTLFVLVIYSMFRVNSTLSFYTLLPLPFLSISIYFVSNLINKKSYLIQQQLSTLNSIAQEVYSGIRIVKSYVQESTLGNYFYRQSNVFKHKSLELAKINALFFPLMLLLIGTSTIITIYVGGIEVAKGNISTGNIAEFVIYVQMLTWPVTAIGWIASIIQQAEASQSRINEFLDTQPTIVNPVQQSIPIHGDIEFKNVSYVYPDTGIRAIDHINFTLKKGEKLGIVGRTASGKTTLADLLLRIFDVSEGEILIDGKDIRKLDLNNLRQRVGYVPQDVFLFSDTIRNNIAFGRTDASQEDVEKYAKYACVHDDIMELSEQYDTLVGERGVTLSGGQKQRVSIARAFIKKPEIIILDDCLSAVDTNTEQKIITYLKDQLKDQTTIMITHRLNALVDFDKILVLDHGKIIEAGTHDALLRNKGAYSEMMEQQQLMEQTK